MFLDELHRSSRPRRAELNAFPPDGVAMDIDNESNQVP